MSNTINKCRAKNPSTCVYHGSPENKREANIITKLKNLFADMDKSSQQCSLQTPEALNLIQITDAINPTNPEHQLYSREQAIKDLGQDNSRPNKDLGFRYYPAYSEYTPAFYYTDTLETEAGNLYSTIPKFAKPKNEVAELLGFTSQKLDANTEVLHRMYSYYVGDGPYEDMDIYMVENILVKNNTPIAYYDFYHESGNKIPPLIQSAEVRPEYRGHKLASAFKSFLNSQLKQPLHSNNYYSHAGYNAIDRSPVWEGEPETKIEDLGHKRFMQNWNALYTHNLEVF